MGSLQTRPAKLDDATRLLELRQRAILELASRDLPAEQIFLWAARVTVADMARRIGEMDIRVAEADGAIVGWVAVDGSYLEGLYTDPRFERQGIATTLLELAEDLVREGDSEVMRAEASPNAEAFYLRRGYVAAGPAAPDGARPILKRLRVGNERLADVSRT